MENSLDKHKNKFMELLPPDLPVARFQRTIITAIRSNPSLVNCDFNSFIGSCITAAVIGLEPDGYTGQGYLIPFKDGNNKKKKVQFIPGYKGFVTIADRAGYTLQGFIVLEGDRIDISRESDGIIVHDRKPGNEPSRKVIGAFAKARSMNRPTMALYMSIDQILAIRDRSAGYQSAKKYGKKTPWIGDDFPQMARKCPVRALARDIPVLPLQLASALETQQDLGRASYVGEDQQIHTNGTEQEIDDWQAPDIPGQFVVVDTAGKQLIVDSSREYAMEIREELKRTANKSEFAALNLDQAKEYAENVPKLKEVVKLLEQYAYRD